MSGQSARTLGKHTACLKEEYLRYRKTLQNKIMRKLPKSIQKSCDCPFSPIFTEDLTFEITNWDEISMDENTLIRIFEDVCQLEKMFIETLYDDDSESMLVFVKLNGYKHNRYLLLEY